MIHVKYTGPARTTMVCFRRFWLWTKMAKGIVIKSTLPHCWIAAPYYQGWNTSRLKCRKAKWRQSRYWQYQCNCYVEDTTEVTNREDDRINSPNASTCITDIIKYRILTQSKSQEWKSHSQPKGPKLDNIVSIRTIKHLINQIGEYTNSWLTPCYFFLCDKPYSQIKQI